MTNKKNNDDDFMETSEARPARIIAEYLEAQELLKKERINNTIVMFGSARIKNQEEAEANLNAVIENITKLEDKSEADKLLKKAENQLEISHYYEKASNLAFKFATWSKQFSPDKKYYICSGGGPGIMEAANKGAFEAGEKTIGLNIHLPFEQSYNKYLTKEQVVNFNYFFMRKFWFAYYAKAFIIFPGGFGTMDEMFEMLTLVQTNKMKKHIPFVLFGTEFFNQLLNLDILEKYSLINPSDKNLFLVTDSVEEAFNYVTERLMSMD